MPHYLPLRLLVPGLGPGPGLGRLLLLLLRLLLPLRLLRLQQTHLLHQQLKQLLTRLLKRL